jgi:hypothetical protein
MNGGNPQQASVEVQEYLLNSGIHRVVTGHKPFGDSPTILRAPTDRFEVVVADTSFSDTTQRDMRGIAVSEVLIRGTLQHNQTVVHGVLR